MDPNTLFGLLSNSLSPNQQERTLAEETLNKVSLEKGFPAAILQVVTSQQVGNEVKQSASIYLKNLIQRSWSPQEDGKFRIHEEDKIFVRTNIFESILLTVNPVRSQLLTCLNKVLVSDFPEHFPGLIERIKQGLVHQDHKVLLASMQCLHQIVKKYEYKNQKERGPLLLVMKETFPTIFQLMNTCLQAQTIEAGEILQLMCKIFYISVQFHLPAELLKLENLAPWIQVNLQIVQIPCPPFPAGYDPDNYHKFPWWKAKKWAMSTLFRLFSRYGNPSMASSEYKAFSKSFLNTVAIEIMKNLLPQFEVIRTAPYYAPRLLKLVLNFFTEAIDHAVTWKAMKDYSIEIVKNIIFPLLCHNNKDEELWDSDPYEYVRTKFDFLEDYKNPDVAAMNYVHQLVLTRKKSTLIPILTFCNTVLVEFKNSPPERRNYRYKDGALSIIGSLATILEKEDSYHAEIEGLLVNHVFPDIESPAGFLRAKCCWIIDQFAGIKFSQPQNILTCLNIVAKGMSDPELPVRVRAAIALGSIVIHEEVQIQIKPLLPNIMNELLKLTNESDLDDLTSVMELMIESFVEDMIPFSVSICSQLRETFLRIAKEADEEEDDNKALTSMSVLRTMITFVRVVIDSPQVLAQLEPVLFPLIEMVLGKSMLDYVDEILEIITTCTYGQEKITPLMWSALPLMHAFFKNNGYDYFSEMVPPLDNYISKDPSMFLSNQNNVTIVLDMIHSTLHGQTGEVEKTDACKLLVIFIMNCSPHIDQLIPSFIEVGLKTYESSEGLALKILSIEVAVSCFYYNPALAFGILDSKGWLMSFFGAWFQLADKLPRIFDLKLSIISLCKILHLPISQVPALVRPNYNQFLVALLKFFEKLPEAYERRKELEEELEDDEDEEGEEEDEEIGDDDDAVDQDEADYIDALGNKVSEGADTEDYDDDDDEYIGLDEELEETTVIDPINEYYYFQETIQMIQNNNREVFAALTTQITEEQNKAIQGILETAQKKRVEEMQAKEQPKQ